MSGMAEVLRQVNKDHGHVHTYRGGAQGCRCGQRDPNMIGSNAWIWGHVAQVSAEALTAAGYGKLGFEGGIWTMTDAEFNKELAEAKAGALEDAADDYRHYETPNARLYLRARAAAVRGEG